MLRGLGTPPQHHGAKYIWLKGTCRHTPPVHQQPRHMPRWRSGFTLGHGPPTIAVAESRVRTHGPASRLALAQTLEQWHEQPRNQSLKRPQEHRILPMNVSFRTPAHFASCQPQISQARPLKPLEFGIRHRLKRRKGPPSNYFKCS